MQNFLVWTESFDSWGSSTRLKFKVIFSWTWRLRADHMESD